MHRNYVSFMELKNGMLSCISYGTTDAKKDEIVNIDDYLFHGTYKVIRVYYSSKKDESITILKKTK